MKITDAIVFDHHQRAGKDKGQIEVRVTVNRKTYYFGTGVKVRKSEFVAGRVVNCLGAPQMNDRIAIVYQKVLACVNERLKAGIEIDAEEIRREVWIAAESVSKDPTMLQWIEDQIGMMRLADGTMKHYYTLLVRLTEYNKLTRWKDLTVENIYRLDAWLHQLKAQDGGQIADSSVYNYHKCLKALLNRAKQFGKISENPYDNMRGKIKRGETENVEYLTEEEMARLESLDLPDDTQLAVARDLFVFQMYTGLSYSDAQAFDIRDYKKDRGRWIHTGNRIKTGVPFVSSLLPPVVQVLERYGMQVPRIHNSDYNRQLKMIGVLSGIKTRLHSHLARHTFATYMLRNGAKIENVSRMLGHTNITQTQRYAKVLAQSVHDDFDMVAARMKKRK